MIIAMTLPLKRALSHVMGYKTELLLRCVHLAETNTAPTPAPAPKHLGTTAASEWKSKWQTAAEQI